MSRICDILEMIVLDLNILDLVVLDWGILDLVVLEIVRSRDSPF